MDEICRLGNAVFSPAAAAASVPSGVSCRTCGRWRVGEPARWRRGARGRRDSTRRGAADARRARPPPSPRPQSPRPPPVPPTRCTRAWLALPRPTAACNHTIRLNNPPHRLDLYFTQDLLSKSHAGSLLTHFQIYVQHYLVLWPIPGIPLQFVQD